MGDGESNTVFDYLPVSYSWRWPVANFIYRDESCYTSDELIFRQKVLSLIADAGISKDFLSQRFAWFKAQEEEAFDTINRGSWVFPEMQKPKDSISEVDFHWRNIDAKSIHWPLINTIGKKIGNYLIRRNELLPAEHLNQAPNFLLLYLMDSLKLIAKDANSEAVMDALKKWRKVLNEVKVMIPPTQGSDRYFLNNLCEHHLKAISSEVKFKSASHALGEKFNALNDLLTNYEDLMTTYMHYLLTDGDINPVAFRLDELIEAEVEDAKHPVVAFKRCLESTELENPIEECTALKLIDGLSSQSKQKYINAHKDLHALQELKRVTKNFVHVINGAGEVLTAFNLATLADDFLSKLNVFIDESKTNLSQLKDINSKFYHEFSKQLQQMSWLHSYFTQKGHAAKLQKFIDNGNQLSRALLSLNSIDVTCDEITAYANGLKESLQQLAYKDPARIEQGFNGLLDGLAVSVSEFSRHQPLLSASEQQAPLIGGGEQHVTFDDGQCAEPEMMMHSGASELRSGLLSFFSSDTTEAKPEQVLPMPKSVNGTALAVPRAIEVSALATSSTLALEGYVPVVYEANQSIMTSSHAEQVFNGAVAQFALWIVLLQIPIQIYSWFNTPEHDGERVYVEPQKVAGYRDKLAFAWTVTQQQNDVLTADSIRDYCLDLSKAESGQLSVAESEELFLDIDYLLEELPSIKTCHTFFAKKHSWESQDNITRRASARHLK